MLKWTDQLWCDHNFTSTFACSNFLMMIIKLTMTDFNYFQEQYDQLRVSIFSRPRHYQKHQLEHSHLHVKYLKMFQGCRHSWTESFLAGVLSKIQHPRYSSIVYIYRINKRAMEGQRHNFYLVVTMNIFMDSHSWMLIWISNHGIQILLTLSTFNKDREITEIQGKKEKYRIRRKI